MKPPKNPILPAVCLMVVVLLLRPACRGPRRNLAVRHLDPRALEVLRQKCQAPRSARIARVNFINTPFRSARRRTLPHCPNFASSRAWSVAWPNRPEPAVPFASNFSPTNLRNRRLHELAGFKNLRALLLVPCPGNRRGTGEIVAVKHLQSLDLGQTNVTDLGMKELAALQKLQHLSLYKTPVTDAGLKELAGLKDLQTLILGSTEITDAGLKELAGLKNLADLKPQ